MLPSGSQGLEVGKLYFPECWPAGVWIKAHQREVLPPDMEGEREAAALVWILGGVLSSLWVLADVQVGSDLQVFSIDFPQY